MKLTVANLQNILLNNRFIWSQILRYFSENTTARFMLSNIGGETARKRINKALTPFIVKRKGACLKYPVDLQQCSPKFYRDGILIYNNVKQNFTMMVYTCLILLRLHFWKLYWPASWTHYVITLKFMLDPTSSNSAVFLSFVIYAKFCQLVADIFTYHISLIIHTWRHARYGRILLKPVPNSVYFQVRAQ